MRDVSVHPLNRHAHMLIERFIHVCHDLNKHFVL